MAMSTWFILVAICLSNVALGIWAVSRIFPRTPAARQPFDPDQRVFSKPLPEDLHNPHMPGGP